MRESKGIFGLLKAIKRGDTCMAVSHAQAQLCLSHIRTFSLIVLSRKGNYKNGVESRRCNEGEAAAATTAAAISAPAEANAVQQRKSKQVQKKQLQS